VAPGTFLFDHGVSSLTSRDPLVADPRARYLGRVRDSAILDEKRALRRATRAALLRLTRADHERAGQTIAAPLARVTDALDDGPVALFASLPHEIETAALDALLAERGRVRLLPTIVDGDLVFRALPTWRSHAELPRDGMGIPTPDDACPVVDLARAVVVFVPGCAFDDTGARLGYGRGYYDRALARLPSSVPTIALLHEVQRVPRVPCDAHDTPVQVTCSPAHMAIHAALSPHVESAIHAAFPRRRDAL